MTAEQRREQLLDVTRDLVGELGFHAVSIEAVARRAGITRPVVYGHFGDLPTLLEALLDRESVRALTQLGEIVPADLAAAGPRDSLLRALEAFLEAVARDPVTWRLVLMPPEGAPESLRARITTGRDAVAAILADAVREGSGGGLGSPDPELTARTLQAISEELARLLLTDPGRYPLDRSLAQARWMLDRLEI